MYETEKDISVNTPAAFDEGEAAKGEVALTFDAVLLYEDLSAGLRGKQVLDCAARLFPRAPHFNLALWRFDVLRVAVVRELALQKASVADIVVLSAHGGKALPQIVKVWLKQWFGRKSDEPCALMVSLNEDSRDSALAAQIVSSLQTETKARDVTVFPHFSKTSNPEDDPTVQTNQRPADPHAARLNDNWRWPELKSHWGINE
jgi:hypothetical protein